MKHPRHTEGRPCRMYAHTGWSRRRTLDRATIVWSQYMFTYWAGQGCFPAFDVGAWLDWGNDPKPPQGKKVGNVPKPGVHSAKPTQWRKSREEFAEEQEEERGGSSEAPGRVSRSPLGWENGLSARRTPPCFPCLPFHCFRGRAGLMWTPVGRPQPDPPMERTPPGSDVSRAYASAEVAAGGGEDRHPQSEVRRG